MTSRTTRCPAAAALLLAAAAATSHAQPQGSPRPPAPPAAKASSPPAAKPAALPSLGAASAVRERDKKNEKAQGGLPDFCQQNPKHPVCAKTGAVQS